MFVLKNEKTGTYLISRNVYAHHEMYGKRFKTVKQAKAYLRSNGLKNSGYTVVQSEYEGGELFYSVDIQKAAKHLLFADKNMMYM